MIRAWKVVALFGAACVSAIVACGGPPVVYVIVDGSGATSDGGQDGVPGEEALPAHCRSRIDLTKYGFNDKVSPSTDPPAKLAVSEVPQFISFGWDDNGRVQGLDWSLDMEGKRKNPSGSPVHATYFLTTSYIGPTAPDPGGIRSAWRKAWESGHEVGLHSLTHTTHADLDEAGWSKEVLENLDSLVKPYGFKPGDGPGIPKGQIIGWRTPFLSTNDALMPVLLKSKLWYDCSLEEGFQYEQDGTNFVWPYTLDYGSPGDALMATWGPVEEKKPITKHPGLWELPVYTFMVPPDDVSASYGGPPNMRTEMKKRQSWFDPDLGKISGFDFNLWVLFHMSKAEVLAVLKFSLDQRLKGNRAPFLIGAHTDYYSDDWTASPNATPAERREAFEEFLDYALAKPEVRVTSYRRILDFMRDPKAMDCY